MAGYGVGPSNTRAVSGFRDHFIDKYFGYRRRYVDYIVAEAPQRANLANLSELARLGFMIAGTVLCAASFAVLALRGIVRAAADRKRVRDCADLEKGALR